MADFNKTLQQIVGYTNLLGVLNTKTSPQDAANLRAKRGQNEYGSFSDSVRANIRKHGIQKTSMAHIVFQPPRIFGTSFKVAGATKINSLATYRADAFAQPGVSMATTEIKRYGIGPIERKPYLPIFTDQQFSFINDSDGLIHKYFYLWMNGIVGFDELPRGNSSKDLFGKLPYEVEYKDQYKTQIEIYVYNEVQNKCGVLQLHNAYPIFLGDVQRGWGDTNQLVRFPVTFTYSHWQYEDIPSTLDPKAYNNNTASKNLQLGQSILKYASVLQTISSTKRPQNVNDILNVVNSGSTLLKSLFPPKVEDTYSDYYNNFYYGQGE